MAAGFNRVFIMGNLTRDPELRYIPSGTAVTSFTVAVNRVYASQSGEKKEEVSFIRVVVWGRRAEVCGEYLSKGSPVFVEGRLKTRSWQTPDGQNRSTMEVIANNVQFLRGGQQPSRASKSAEMPNQDEMGSVDLGSESFENMGNNSKTKGENNEVPF